MHLPTHAQYIYMHIYMHIYMYICIHVYMYAHASLRSGFLGCVCVLLRFYVAFSAFFLCKIQTSSILNDLIFASLLFS